MILQVMKGQFYFFHVIAKKSKTFIACVAKQTTHTSCCMIVIYCHNIKSLPATFLWPFHLFIANATTPPAGHPDNTKTFKIQTIFFTEHVISATFLRCSPFCSMHSIARPTSFCATPGQIFPTIDALPPDSFCAYRCFSHDISPIQVSSITGCGGRVKWFYWAWRKPHKRGHFYSKLRKS